MSRPRKLPVRWTTPKGFVALLSFVGLASLVVVLSVMFFRTRGVEDPYLLTLIPIGVVLVLTSSWTYLTGQIAFVPRKTLTIRKKRKRGFSARITSLESRFFAKFSVKSAIVIVALFLFFMFFPYILLSPPYMGIYRLIYDRIPQLQSTMLGVYNGLFKPLREMEEVYKYALSENLAAFLTAFVAANWRWFRRKLS